MRLDQVYNVNELPTDDRTPIPAGTYEVTIEDADLRDTKRGTGKYIALSLRVEGPSHAGRMVFDNLNIRNQNPKAENIGLAQFGNLLRAIGLTSIQDTDQLIGHRVRANVKIERSEEWGDKNGVKSYQSATASPLPGPSMPVQQSPQPQTQTSSAPPWAGRG